MPSFFHYEIFYESIFETKYECDASLSNLITKSFGTAQIKMFFKNSNYFKLVSTNFSNNTNASILFEVQVQHHGHAITFFIRCSHKFIRPVKVQNTFIMHFCNSVMFKKAMVDSLLRWIAKKLLSCCLRFHIYICTITNKL